MFERRRDAEGQAWYRVSLLYRSTEQIRSGEMLTLDNAPLRYDLRFAGVDMEKPDAVKDGMAVFAQTVEDLKKLV